MSVSTESGTKAKQQAMEAMEFEVATNLKRSWKIISIAAGQAGKNLPDDPTSDIVINDKTAKDPAHPTPEELEQLEKLKEERWKQLARQLIDERKLKLNETEVSITELDRQLDASTKQALQIDSLGKLIPTRKQVNLVTDTIGNSVAKNTGTGIGFLDNWFGGATFGAVISGLFSWIFSGFKGGFAGLKETIAANVGQNYKASATSGLTSLRDRLRGTENDISGFMSNTTIAAIGNKLEHVPLEQIKPGTAQPSQRLRDVKIGDIDDVMRETVRSKMSDTLSYEIGNAFRKEERFKGAYANESKDRGWWDSAKDLARQGGTLVGLRSEGARQRRVLDRIQTDVSEHLSKIMTAPDYTYKGDEPALAKLVGKKLSAMSADDRALVIAAEVRQTIMDLAASDKKDHPEDESLYAVVALILPEEVRKSILEKDNANKIPWLVSGNIKVSVGNVTAPGAHLDDSPLIGKAAPEIAKIVSGQLEKELGAGTDYGKEVHELIGRDLGKQDFDAIAKGLSPAIVKINGVDRKEITEKKGGAYGEVAKRFREALKDPANRAVLNGSGLNDAALDVLADTMAVKFVQDELKVKDAVPEKFAREMKARLALVAAPVVEAGLKAKLAEMAAKLRTANGNKPVNVDAAAGAVKDVVAARVSDGEALKAMTGAEYHQYVDAVRGKLEGKSTEIGIDKNNTALLDMMAIDIASGSIEKRLGKDAPKMPEDMAKRRAADEAGITGRVVSGMLEKELGAGTDYGKEVHELIGRDLGKQDFDAIAKGLSPAIVKINGVDRKEITEKKGGAYGEVAKRFREALKDPANRAVLNGSGLNDAALDVLADTMAVKFVQDELKVKDAVPEKFAREMKARLALVAAPVVEAGLKAKLAEMAAKLRTANGNKPVNVDAAAGAVKDVVAARVSDGEALKAMTGAEYHQYVDAVRGKLEGKSTEIGIDKNNTALLDMMAIDIASGSIEKRLGKDAPKMPEDMAKRRAADEAGITGRVVSGMLEKELGAGTDYGKEVHELIGRDLGKQDFDAIAKGLSPAIVKINGVDRKEITEKKGGAYGEVAKRFREALKDPANRAVLNGSGLNDAALDVLADTMAVKFVQDELKVKDAVPEKFAREMKARLALVAAPVVEAGLKAKLAEMAAKLRTANGNKPVNVDAAAGAVKDVVAARVSDGEALKAMTGAEYHQYVDAVRGKLEGKSTEIGIDKNNTALLDMMAIDIASGSIEKRLGKDAPKMPEDMAKRRAADEALLTDKVISQKVREMLLPKLTGVVSLTDNRKDPDNRIIANIIAIDATRNGHDFGQRNIDAILKNVSEVVLYHKLQLERTGKPVNENELKKHITGALSDHDCGLGQLTIDELSNILTKKCKESLEQTEPTISNPQKDESESHANAQRLLAFFKSEVKTKAKAGLLASDKAYHDVESVETASKAIADAMGRIVTGQATVPEQGNPSKTYDYSELKAKYRGDLVRYEVRHLVGSRLDEKWGWSITGWKDKTAKSMANTITAQIAYGERDLSATPVDTSVHDDALKAFQALILAKKVSMSPSAGGAAPSNGASVPDVHWTQTRKDVQSHPETAPLLAAAKPDIVQSK